MSTLKRRAAATPATFPKSRKRRARIGIVVDLGPPERLARGEVRIEGDGRARRGRAFNVVNTFGIPEQQAAAWLDGLFEAAAMTGFHCSRFDRGTGGGAPGGQSERAAQARRVLWRVSGAIGPAHWDVVFHVLFFMEAQINYAIRAGIRKREVRPRLQSALAAVAEYRRQG